MIGWKLVINDVWICMAQSDLHFMKLLFSTYLITFGATRNSSASCCFETCHVRSSAFIPKSRHRLLGAPQQEAVNLK